MAARFTSQLSLRTPGPVGAATLAASLFALPAQAAQPSQAAPSRLDPLVVTGSSPVSGPFSDPVAPYKADRVSNAKLPEPLVDTPRSITVIPEEVITDTGALSFRDLMRAQPGVTLGTGEGGNAFGDRFFVRGFDTRNDIYIDNVRDPGVTSREIFAVEQVEIVKGPSSTIGGRGTTGGAISLVSKQPAERDFLTATALAGSDRTRRVTVDLNQQVSSRFAFRVVGMHHDSGAAGRRYVFNNRDGVAVSARYRASDSVSVSADYYHLRADELPDWGVSYDVVANRPLVPDRRTWYGVLARDYRDTWADIYTVKVEARPFVGAELRALLRYGQTLNDYVATAPENPNLTAADPARWTLLANPKQRNAVTSYWAQQTDLTWRFQALGVGHVVVAGYELGDERVRNRQYANLASEVVPGIVQQPSTVIQPVFATNPNAPWPFGKALSAIRGTEVDTRSAYIMETLKFGSRWQLSGGVRLDSYDISLTALTIGNRNRSVVEASSTLFNGNLGLVYKPAANATVYAAFGTSSNPSGEQLDAASGEYGGLTITNAALAPELNKSYEVGAKWDVADGHLALTAAVFRIDKTHARVQTGAGASALFASNGAQRVEGIEVTVSGAVTSRLSLFGGAILLRGKIVGSPLIAQVGEAFPNIAKSGFSLVARYKVGSRAYIGTQTNYGGEKYGGTVVAGNTRVPAYFRYDLFGGFQVKRSLLVSFNLLNAGDKLYFDALYRSATPFTYVAPGRAAYLKLTYTR